MIDLQVLGLHPDGNRLILSDQDGQRYSLQITDDLRDIIRRERAQLAAVRSQPGEGQPSPRDIQQMLRAGMSAERISADYHTTVERVRRYESPILAERVNAARQACATQIASQPDSPTLGDLVLDRLAARGVDPATLQWDAVRTSNSTPWEVIVRFVQSAQNYEAHWSFERTGRTLSALDQEAIWLTETAAPAGANRGLADLPRPQVTDSQSMAATEQLVDQVNSQRGVRQEVDWQAICGDEDADADADAPAAAKASAATDPASAPTRAAAADQASASQNAQPGATSGAEEGAPAAPPAADASGPQQDQPPTPPATGANRVVGLTHRPAPAPPESTNDAPHPPEPPALLSVEQVSPAGEAAGAHKRGKNRRSGGRGHREPLPPWEDIIFGPKSHR